jgi:bifunctional ADP-heptose synthase (sugar kinase/adenylyltransferase)
MVITIASPDKISISMFLSFMRFCLGKEYVTAISQSLWSKDSLEDFIEKSLKKTDKLLFSYYAKGKINKDPLTVIPEKFIAVSDVVIWMDLYSTEWKIIKDTSSQTPVFMDRWNKNMAKMNSGSIH